jgi:hypothetical protein
MHKCRSRFNGFDKADRDLGMPLKRLFCSLRKSTWLKPGVNEISAGKMPAGRVRLEA